MTQSMLAPPHYFKPESSASYHFNFKLENVDGEASGTSATRDDLLARCPKGEATFALLNLQCSKGDNEIKGAVLY